MSPQLGVIFDVDGVLVDSYDAHFQSWRQAARQFGFAMTRKQFVGTFGRTSRDIIRALWPEQATSDARIAEIDEVKEAMYREIVAADFPAMDGAAELIRGLIADGFAIAVGSSGPPPNVALVLERLHVADQVPVVVTGADVQHGKPHPEVFQKAAQRLCLPPSHCLVIEDAPAGVEAAHRAGMRSIGLASRGRTRADLQAAERVVNSLREISPPQVKAILQAA